MGINGVSSYANTYTYGNVKDEKHKRILAYEKNDRGKLWVIWI